MSLPSFQRDLLRLPALHVFNLLLAELVLCYLHNTYVLPIMYIRTRYSQPGRHGPTCLPASLMHTCWQTSARERKNRGGSHRTMGVLRL